MDGEVPRTRPSNEILVYPENWDEMVKKYQEREEEQLQRVMARRKAESAQELEQLASKAIVTRANRAASDYKPLKDRTVLRESNNPEIVELKKKLHEEITAIGRRVLGGEEKAGEPAHLKGRVTPGPQIPKENKS